MISKTFSTMTEKVRLDRWLWAARFFKTRAQAKAAIEGGKVELHMAAASGAEGKLERTAKPKVSKEIGIGDRLTIQRGWSPETVTVIGLSEQRGNAAAASLLFEESLASIEARETEVARRRMERAGLKLPERRPSKRDRRELKKMKGQP
jgi:ribosome-associated heat shock protein Hsp15